MKTYNEIASELFERREEHNKKAAQRRKTIGIAALSLAAIAAFTFITVRILNKPGSGKQDVQNGVGPTISEGPIETVSPTEAVTPTVSPITNPPVSDPPVSQPPRTYYFGEFSDYCSAAGAILAGGKTSDTFSADNGGVFFDFEGDRLIAYNTASWIGEFGEQELELYDPIASYPAELGIRAKESIAAFDGTITADQVILYGYIGENYVIFTDAPQMGRQSHAIFRTDDGENWYEFGAAVNCPFELTGGCILDENVGILCFFDRSRMRFDNYTPRQLSVYKTTDGGRTWVDMELWIPEEYDPYVAPVHVFSPVFSGDHGIMLMSFMFYDVNAGESIDCTAAFETYDGGVSWTFAPEVFESTPL